MIVGRVFVLIMCGVGVCWVPILAEIQGAQLFIYILAISAYLAPPVAAVYVIAILWKRSNEPGAFWALIVGFATGIIRMALDFIYKKPKCGETDDRPSFFERLSFHVLCSNAVSTDVISLCRSQSTNKASGS